MHCGNSYFMWEWCRFAITYWQVELYLLSEEVSTTKVLEKLLLKRTLEEVRYAVIGVPFLRISFQASFQDRRSRKYGRGGYVFLLPVTE